MDQFRIETLLSARLFVAPQRVGDRVYFVSDLSGRLSLYAMNAREGGSVPEPLLPPDIAMQNPHLMNGYPFKVLPKLGKILIMLDQNGDENYRPMWIPLAGGRPVPAFGDQFARGRVYLLEVDSARGIAYLNADSHTEAMITAYRADLAADTVEAIDRSEWGRYVSGVNAKHTKIVLADGYTMGDNVLYLWERGRGSRVLAGTPLDARAPGQAVPLTGFGAAFFTPSDRGLLLTTTLFEDARGLGYIDLRAVRAKDAPGVVRPVKITGVKHTGAGELEALSHVDGDRYSLQYNIDGVSWLYEAAFDEAALKMKLTTVLCGRGAISDGVLSHPGYDKISGAHTLSVSTATSPTQIYSVDPSRAARPLNFTRERLLGLAPELLARGEDASFTSHDGLRVSARLYLPAKALGFKGARPLVYYIHGGPQSQERPDFAWFSMPLIQFLTLSGFAVFVPNVRGSTGYGLAYTKHVDRDWGGQDRLDHVHAMTKILPEDKRLDVGRAAVVGRSYGGYMTLTLAARHPELWKAAVDMFGPYDLLSFMDRIPATWKSYFAEAVGHPERDRDFLTERSPKTHIAQITCPMLVIQGANDPRVVERESRDVVESLREQGKSVDYLVFPDEGHDVLKLPNKIRCYNAITDFFKTHLKP